MPNPLWFIVKYPSNEIMAVKWTKWFAPVLIILAVFVLPLSPVQANCECSCANSAGEVCGTGQTEDYAGCEDLCEGNDSANSLCSVNSGTTECDDETAPGAQASGSSTAPDERVQLPNPLGTSSVPIIVGRIIKILSGGAGMIALMMFVYGGFQWLTAGGNAEKIKKGKDIILWSILGLVVMFSSYLATRYILETLVPAAVR